MSNPTDDFDNWDDWGDNSSPQPDPMNNQSGTADNSDGFINSQDDFQSSDDWDNWSTSDTQQQSSDNGGWDDWGADASQQRQSGGFIQPDPTVGDDNQSWGSQAPDFQSQSVQEPPIQTHFSMKTIAFIVAGVLLVLALLLLGLDKVKVTKKDTTSNQQQVQQEQEQPQQGQAQQGQVQQDSQTSNTTTQQPQQNQQQSTEKSQSALNSATLVEIPDSTSMTYSNDTLKANGKVTDKKKYVQGKQIVYCVEITIAVGSSSETVNYYCTSATFNQIGKGDILIVNYVQVEDSYISITNVEK